MADHRMSFDKFSIAIETPLQDEVRSLVAELNAVLLELTPPEHCHHLTVEQMADASTTVFIARDGGQAVACGALKRHADGIGEVKRIDPPHIVAIHEKILMPVGTAMTMVANTK